MGQKLGRFNRKQYLRKRPTPMDHNFFHKLYEKSSWTDILTFPKKTFSGPTAAWSYKQIDPNSG